MTTALDKKIVPKVLALINRIGISATFSVGTATMDESTGEGDPDGAGTPTTVKSTPPLNYDRKLVDGVSIKNGDAQVFIAGSGLSFTPSNGMKVNISSIEWTVKSVGRISAGDDVAAYELQLRQE